MDYEKEYKAMVQRCMELHETGNFLTKKQMEIICPELADSDDERIRKSIVTIVNQYARMCEKEGDPCEASLINDALAYLERQKDLKYSEEQMEDIRQYAYNKGIVDAKEKQKEQQPAEWSEEDEKHLYNAIEAVKYTYDVSADSSGAQCIEFLKSLPERFNLQSKQEWSEEEKGILLECISALQNSSNWLLADKLKSLRPQPSWKPSEEQIGILGKVFAGCQLKDSERDSMVDLFYHLKDMI